MVETVKYVFCGNPFISSLRKKCVTFLMFWDCLYNIVFSSHFRLTGSSINVNSVLFFILR